MSAIFISHSSGDGELAAELARRLDERGHHSVFLDFDPDQGIVAGQSWERTLYRKLRACRAVIALCTDGYLGSHWCFAEIALARMEGKHLIALQADPLDAHAKMPAILTERQFIDLRSGREEGFRRLWRALDEFDVAGGRDWNPKEPPYLGLDAYQEEHAPVFFGREDESLSGIELLERGAPPLVMVLGASGSGKSSLVRAGMLPRLRQRDTEWLIVGPFRPGREPFAELTESLVEAHLRYAREHVAAGGGRERLRERLLAAWDAALPTAPAAATESAPPAAEAGTDERLHRLIELLERLHADPPAIDPRLRDHLAWSLDDLRQLCGARPPPTSAPSSAAHVATPLVDAARQLRRLAGRRDARILLVVDQFEELLGGAPAAGKAGGFLALLRASLEAAGGLLMVLGTMRSDFLGTFQRRAELQGIDFESLSLGPMRVDGMRRVIEMPARLAAIELEAGLADRLLADTATPDALPLLSFTLWVLYRDRRDTGRLEIAEYERLGGLQGTISREADAVLAAARREHREDALRTALVHLARVGEDGGYARRAADWEHPDIQRVKPVLDRLVDRRVLVSRMEGDTPVVEVAHEALFRAWAPLKAWLDSARADLLLTRQLERDAAAWQDSGRPADALWRGGRLLQARELLERAAADRRDVVARFVRAALRRRQWQRFMLTATTAIVIATLAGFLLYALDQTDRARVEKARALDLARVSVAAEWMAADPTKAALVLLEVADPATTRFAPRRLGEALHRARVVTEFPHAEPVNGVAINADGTRVLTASGKQAVIWDARSGHRLHTLMHDDTVIDAAFDPTGRLAVTRTGIVDKHYFGDHAGNAARVWDVAAGTQRFAITHGETLAEVRFSPDGMLLASVADDSEVRLWDTTSGHRRFALPHPAKVAGTVFSPTGVLLATVAEDGVRLWTVATGTPALATPLTQEGGVSAVAFSADDTIVATAGYRGARLWDRASGEERYPLSEDLLARSVQFSADGQHLVVASDSEARVWHVVWGAGSFAKPSTITHDRLAYAAFSADGAMLVTASGHASRQGYGNLIADDTVRFWDTSLGWPIAAKELQDGHELMGAAFDRGHTLAVTRSAERAGGGRYETLHADTTARLWDVDVRDRRLVHVLEHPERVTHAAFNADGTRLLTVAGAMVRLWRPGMKQPPLELKHGGRVHEAAFTADGRFVVSAAADGAARVWDAQSGTERFAAKHRDGVEHAALVAGDGMLATISAHTLRLWRWRDGGDRAAEPLFAAPADVPAAIGDMGYVVSVDGRLAAIRSEKTVEVWDVAGGTRRFTLPHGGWVRTMAFLGDGGVLVTGADEDIARAWDTASGKPKFPLEHTAQLLRVAASPDGRTILTLANDGIARLWDAETGTARATLEHGCGARDAWFVADGTRAVTASEKTGGESPCEARVVLWDVDDGRAQATAATGNAKSVGFSPSGKLMYTRHNARFEQAQRWARAAWLVHVWDADSGEERFAEPFLFADDVQDIAFSPDDGWLMTTSGNEVRLWAVDGQRLRAILAGTTTVCLPAAFRRQNLGEPDSEAQRGHRDCERRHGRE